MALAPTSSAQSVTRSAVTQCERSGHDTTGIKTDGNNLKDLGAPVIMAARGSDMEVLFIDRRANYMRDCIFSRHQEDLIVANPLSSYPAVGPNGIDDDDNNDLTANCAELEPGVDSARGEEFGRVGTNVTGVTFRNPHGAPIRGTVWHGFYEVWWTTREYPVEVTLTMKSGKILKVNIPNDMYPPTEPSPC